MNLIFNMENVICTKSDNINHCKPLVNVTEFMQWIDMKGHHITIWCERENTLENKLMTEEWLKWNQVPYKRLLFDRPENPLFVDETPPNAKYYKSIGDNGIVSELFEEWKDETKRQHSESSRDSR